DCEFDLNTWPRKPGDAARYWNDPCRPTKLGSHATKCGKVSDATGVTNGKVANGAPTQSSPYGVAMGPGVGDSRSTTRLPGGAVTVTWKAAPIGMSSGPLARPYPGSPGQPAANDEGTVAGQTARNAPVARTARERADMARNSEGEERAGTRFLASIRGGWRSRNPTLPLAPVPRGRRG